MPPHNNDVPPSSIVPISNVPPEETLPVSFSGVVWMAHAFIANPRADDFNTTYYLLCLACPVSGRIWLVRNRFSSFHHHRHVLLKLAKHCLPHTRELFSALLTPFPSRYYLEANSARVVAERVSGLKTFANALLWLRGVCMNLVDAPGHPKLVMKQLLTEIEATLEMRTTPPRKDAIVKSSLTGTECAICLQSLGLRSRDEIPSPHRSKPLEMLGLLCGHVFHRGCAARWLIQHLTCPLCRAHV
ncbi:Aste57867_24345 [Aphanomyces stellatus]|uniref:Aste57867_24345 protein n=1 Tax=Aphanomyces stellatus TaxID=120398 RepID=A0A485LQ88_9STRA|nr:hypothetical protein As57867_024269 [Aphanomyces stellatus]VFU00985.1 Aste57867_24345 [Aphanomyces stellatus]